MRNLVEFDIGDALLPRVPLWLTQTAVGAASAFGFTIFRLAFDAGVAASPFAHIYPGVLLATLLGRWQAGLISAIALVLGSWYYMMPVRNSFAFGDGFGPGWVVMASVAALITVAIAEIFRRAVRNSARERDRQIAERDLFLEEFDHRVRNNFAIVVSLLQLQRQRSDAATAAALDEALSRVESIARAHHHLYRGSDQPGAVQISDYLDELCTSLANLLSMRAEIALKFSSDKALVPRDRAVSIGLIVNELVTNAAKHAFHGRNAGIVDVSFHTVPGGWRLVVADDGIGLPPLPVETKRSGGLGSKLIEAFVRQANGKIATESDTKGTRVTVELAAD